MRLSLTRRGWHWSSASDHTLTGVISLSVMRFGTNAEMRFSGQSSRLIWCIALRNGSSGCRSNDRRQTYCYVLLFALRVLGIKHLYFLEMCLRMQKQNWDGVRNLPSSRDWNACCCRIRRENRGRGWKAVYRSWISCACELSQGVRM